MAVAAYKTYSSGEVLSAADLNASFSQIHSNGEDLGWPATKAKDLNGFGLVMDANGDTTIDAGAVDDQIDIALAGADDFAIKANDLDVLAGSKVSISGDGSAIDAANSIGFGVGMDGAIYSDGTNLIIDGAAQVDVAIAGTSQLQLTAAKAENLDDISALAHSDGNFVVSDGTDWVAESGATVRTSLGLGTMAVENVAAVPAMTYAAEQSYADNLLTRPTIKDYGETVVAKGNLGATPAFDVSAGNVQTGTNSEAITSSTMTNWPATGIAGSLTLFLTNGGAFSIVWPTSVDWPGGTAPTLTASGVDILVFTSIDAGATVHGMLASKDSK